MYRSLNVLFFVITPFVLHLLFLDNPIHDVVNRQILQLSCVCQLIEDQFEFIVSAVGDQVLLAVRPRRRREDRIYCYSTRIP